MPKVSVLMPVHNGARYIEEAINSILEQSFADFDLLIFDDKSTDRTCEIIEKYNDKRIKLFKLDIKSNLPLIKNYAMSKINSEYFAFMDADDISYLDRLEKEVNFLDQNKDIDVINGSHRNFLNSDRVFFLPTEHDEIAQTLMFHTTICHGGSMLRSETILNSNVKFRNEYFVCEDYAFWVDILPFAKFANLKDFVLKIRVNDNNSTSSSKNMTYKKKLRKIILDQIHKDAFEFWDFYMSEYDLKIFNQFVGDCSIPNQSKFEVDKLEDLFVRMNERVKIHPRLKQEYWQKEFDKRMKKYRSLQIE